MSTPYSGMVADTISAAAGRTVCHGPRNSLPCRNYWLLYVLSSACTVRTCPVHSFPTRHARAGVIELCMNHSTPTKTAPSPCLQSSRYHSVLSIISYYWYLSAHANVQDWPVRKRSPGFHPLDTFLVFCPLCVFSTPERITVVCCISPLRKSTTPSR